MDGWANDSDLRNGKGEWRIAYISMTNVYRCVVGERIPTLIRVSNEDWQGGCHIVIFIFFSLLY